MQKVAESPVRALMPAYPLHYLVDSTLFLTFIVLSTCTLLSLHRRDFVFWSAFVASFALSLFFLLVLILYGTYSRLIKRVLSSQSGSRFSIHNI